MIQLIPRQLVINPYLSIYLLTFELQSLNGLTDQSGRFYFPYQSEMTHIWENGILTKSSCDLKTYTDSMNLHLELIRILTNHLKKINGKEVDACPIT